MISIDPIVLFGGIGSILGTVVAAGLTQKWVWGYSLRDKQAQLDDMETDRDFWRDIALKLLTVNDKAIGKVPAPDA